MSNKQQLLKYWNARKEQVSNLSVINTAETPKAQQERIHRALTDYEFFCGYYFPHLVTDRISGKNIPNAYFHNQAASYVRNNRRSRALFEWARGHAKSTHMTVLIPLWLKAQAQFKTMVVVGKSEKSAARLLSDLQVELQYNQRYIHDFGNQVKHGSWEEGAFVTEDDTAFFSLGRGQSPRGLKHKGCRPDYIVVDDIDDDQLVRNEQRVDETLNWLLKALFNTMDGGNGRFIVVGNRIGKHSVIARLAENPNFYHILVNALDDKGRPAWYQKYTLPELMELKATIGELAWQQEYMNNPITAGSIFKQINYAKPLPLHHYAYVVCYTDPSFRNSDKSDYKATVLVGKTKQGSYHVLKAFIQKVSISHMIAWHYDLYLHTKDKTVVTFFMEANYIQDMLLDEFHKEGNRRGLHLPIRGDKRSKPDKFQRIENLEPYFSNGRLFFNEEEKENPNMRTLIEQFLLFQRGSRMHDDGPDAVEGAIFILNQKTYEEHPPIFIGRNHFSNKKRF